jgi:uncharacterized low-complexity protein
MNTTQKTIALAISSAFALSIAATTVNATENPFSAKSLSSGYQVAENDTKMKDGKCGTGKCGANKKKAMKEKMGEKAHEGSCSAEKAAEGKCSAEMKKEMSNKVTMDKAKEGSCSAEKAAEGKCSAEMKSKAK